LARPFRNTTELAAPLMRVCQPPAGVQVMVLFDAYDWCHSVVKASREKHFYRASTLKRNSSLFEDGWKLKVGRYGTNLFRLRPRQL